MTMCSVDAPKTNRAVAPRTAGRKRPLALVVYNPAAAEKRARLSARPGALVPFLPRRPVAAAAPRAEPSWLRKRLDLRADLTVHFIAEKAVTRTDLDGQQNRFRIPTEGVLRHLRPILLGEELDAANIPRVGALEAPKAPKKKKKKTRQPPTTEEELLLQQGKKVEKRTKKKGVKHGGLPVHLWNVDAGCIELRLTRWKSSRAIVIKGGGYLNFITRCGFEKNDVVEVWAFKQREFRYFGVRFLQERPLCVVLAKKQQQPPAGTVARDGEAVTN
jgi:hypothetical protein